MTNDYLVTGSNPDAPFDLTVHRGDGMALLATNWRGGQPSRNFVGFGIQYCTPGSTKLLNVQNRLTFEGAPEFGERQPSMKAPIQKFRWVHFPYDANLPGKFTYTVTPVFMDDHGQLSYGTSQEAALELNRETHPGRLNVSFTRGFIASQAFVDHFVRSKGADPDDGDLQDAMDSLLPRTAKKGLNFVPTHPKADDALAWMGFEARQSILEVLDAAIADTATTVRVVAYELSQPKVVSRLEQLGNRLWIIIDDSGDHKPKTSGEKQAEVRLRNSAGSAQVRRQHMGNLQHNKTIVVTGPNHYTALCGSTNFSWRGFCVQNNNAVVITGEEAVQPFADAFEQYWSGGAAAFGKSTSAKWTQLDLGDLDVSVCFSPHSPANAVLSSIADDLRAAESSVLYSLAFLYQTKGPVRHTVKELTEDPAIFVAGISDRAIGGINVQTPDGNRAPVRPEALTEHVPAPFSQEPTGGSGVRLHHKFVVIDFDKPSARVYLGSYNFSNAADNENGENLVVIRDRRVATSYAIEAVRLFDHYQFRVRQADPDTAVTELALRKPPAAPAEEAWFDADYTDPNKIRDRELFS
jgi:hypothetical protein